MNDVIVQKELESIVSKYGWPGIRMNGRTGMVSLLLFNAGAEWFYKMKTVWIEEIDKGNLYPWVFAGMADRVCGNSDLPCRYGTVFCGSDITPEIRANCKKVGVPIGKVRKRRRLD